MGGEKEVDKALVFYDEIEKKIEAKFGIGKKWEVLTFKLKKIICEEIMKNDDIKINKEEIEKMLNIK